MKISNRIEKMDQKKYVRLMTLLGELKKESLKKENLREFMSLIIDSHNEMLMYISKNKLDYFEKFNINLLGGKNEK